MKPVKIDVEKYKAIFNSLIFRCLALFLSPVPLALAGDNLIYVHPKTLSPTVEHSFSPLVVSRNTNTIYVSGQVARDLSGNIVGGDDLEKQMVQALTNIKTALAEVGATMQNIARLEIYIVDYSSDKLPAYSAAMKQFFDSEHLPANTLLGIESLAFPGYMVEITATAVLDSQ
ncbi:MAG: enamine deaminase RidA (YjgF/YER057c/UK114 family) [Gammaproteobacteria bacterium]|jgi:enamine deaminase RidA (YjgF/YER057c/UK114 family)